jgi:NADH-quinone oxidoreductase subunit L
MGAFAHNPVLYYIGMAGALMTAFYMFRLYAMTFLGKFRGTHEQEHHLHESPAAMTIPLVILAVLSVTAGFIGIPEVFAHGAHHLEHFLEPIFADSNKIVGERTHIDHTKEIMMMGISTALIALIIFFAISKFSKYQQTEKEETGVGKLLENKWYVDELYNTIIVKPMMWLAKFLNNIFERYIVDGIVNGVGKAVQYSGRQLRLVQSGQVGGYILLMVLSILVFFVIQLFLKK